jgi:hypothetical protein
MPTCRNLLKLNQTLKPIFIGKTVALLYAFDSYLALPSDLNKARKKGLQCKIEKSRKGQLCKIRKTLQPSKTCNVNSMHDILDIFTPSSRFHNPQGHSILVVTNDPKISSLEETGSGTG